MTGYSDDIKAAVIAALLQGQSVSSVAKQYRIPRTTVRLWKAGVIVPGGADKKAAIGEKVLAYLDANLDTLKAQVELFKDPGWLRQQAASEVAVLHGVLADKAIRLLEALTSATENEQEEDSSV